MKLKKDIKELNRFSMENPITVPQDKDDNQGKAKERRAGKEGKIDTNKVVLEYLLKSGFNAALETFKRELTTRNESIAPKVSIKTLLAYFDAGNSKEFFIDWDKSVSEADIDDFLKVDLLKLEFYLRIYFCVFSIHSKGRNLKVGSL